MGGRMVFRWSRWSPQIALAPAVVITFVAFVGATVWTIYMSFTRSRPLPRIRDRLGRLGAPVRAAVQRRRLARLRSRTSLILGVGSALAIVFGFVLAAMMEREKRGEAFFRTDLPLSARDLAHRHRHRLALDVQSRRSASRTSCTDLGWADASFNWLAEPTPRCTASSSPRSGTGSGFYMALMLAGLKLDQHRDLERGAARRRQRLAALRRDHHPDDEVHLPDLRHPALARRGQGLRHRRRDDQWRARAHRPGRRPTSPSTPTSTRSNIGFASSAAVIMLLITIAVFLPLVLLIGWQARRREAAVQQ